MQGVARPTVLAAAAGLALSLLPSAASGTATITPSPAVEALAAQSSVARGHEVADAGHKVRGRKTTRAIAATTPSGDAFTVSAVLDEPTVPWARKTVRQALAGLVDESIASQVTSLGGWRDSIGACTSDMRASLQSTWSGSVVAGKYLSVAIHVFTFPGDCGGVGQNFHATGTWRHNDGKPLTRSTFVKSRMRVPGRGDYPFTRLLADIRNASDQLGKRPGKDCRPDPRSPFFNGQNPVEKAVTRRWQLTRSGVRFWIQRYEADLDGACSGGATSLRVSWRSLNTTRLGDDVAHAYGKSGGTSTSAFRQWGPYLGFHGYHGVRLGDAIHRAEKILHNSAMTSCIFRFIQQPDSVWVEQKDANPDTPHWQRIDSIHAGVDGGKPRGTGPGGVNLGMSAKKVKACAGTKCACAKRVPYRRPVSEALRVAGS